MTRYVSGILLLPAMLLADFSYSESTRMTGGMLMNMSRSLGAFSKDLRKVGEPTISTVTVKGNRMMTTSDRTAQIFDLDKETVTNIDFEKQTYSTITFTQMREAMEKAMERAKAKTKEMESKRPNRANEPAPERADVSFKMDIKETGKVQMISGVNAKEVIMTMTLESKDKQTGQSGGMDTMSSIWVADSIPGYEEVKAFQQRMAAKMAGSFASSSLMRQNAMMAMDPRMMDSMQKMAKEAEKLQGVHVRQITKMGANLDPAKASEITDPSAAPQGPAAGDAAGKAASQQATQSATSRIGGRLGNIGGLGGLGGFGRGKKKQEEPPPQENQQAQAAASGVLMEMVMEMNNFSTAPVDGSKFAVPGGFKQVENPMLRSLKE